MLIELLFGLVQVVFLDPLAAVLPTMDSWFGVGVGLADSSFVTVLGSHINEMNALFPIYWPLFLAAKFIELAMLMLPVAMALWLWRVVKP
jgi:hypothetical protein